MPGAVLYSWGPVQFEVYPLSLGEVDHTTGTDWARKEIAGAAIYREWVGENEEEIHLRGKVFPHFYAKHMNAVGPRRSNTHSMGGLSHLDVMDNLRRLGQAHVLIRGGTMGAGVAWHLGWFVIERLSRGHSFLAPDGIGQQIQFEATFQRVPVPDDPSDYFTQLWSGIRLAG